MIVVMNSSPCNPRYLPGLFGICCLALLALSGCATIRTKPALRAHARTAILSINDVYRIEGIEPTKTGGLARVRALRGALAASYPEIMLLHAGDALYPSDLSRLYDGEQMIDVLNRMDGDAEAFDGRMLMTFGNHEFDRGRAEDAASLAGLIRSSQFRWLGSNVRFAPAARAAFELPNLGEYWIVSSGGIAIGFFSITTGSTHPEYVESFEPPLEIARRLVPLLRAAGAELVVALTHLEASEDEEILRRLGSAGPDLIVGGHDHSAMAKQIGERWLVKADAEAASAQLIEISRSVSGAYSIEPRLLSLSGTNEDPEVRERAEYWKKRYDATWCAERMRSAPGCLAKKLAVAPYGITAEESVIRRYETGLGNWIADLMVEEFRDLGAQIAFLNAGTLRLNYDLPPGADVSAGQIETLFGFPAPLRLIKIDGRTLQRVVERAVQEWRGNGWWLQVSGFAFRHDPERQSAYDLTLTSGGVARPIDPDEELLAVTSDYLINPKSNQDGYSMLNPDLVIAEGRDLKEAALEAMEPGTIGARSEGRICNVEIEAPCLAIGR